MISVFGLVRSTPVEGALFFGHDDRPVYVRFPDGTLHQVDAIEDATIKTSAGDHDVIAIRASILTSEEAS